VVLSAWSFVSGSVSCLWLTVTATSTGTLIQVSSYMVKRRY